MFTIVPCKQCSRSVTIDIAFLKHGAVCDQCILDDITQRQGQAAKDELLSRWIGICPPLYNDTDLTKLPCKQQTRRALDWKPGQKCGLNLWGVPRTGKTRTLLEILKREHFKGAKVRFFGPSEFAHQCELREFRTASWIRGMGSYDIVAFDDIDKCKLTRTQEEKFFALLDDRMRNQKPTMFTGNSEGGRLQLHFKNGAAIVGRIREHCTSIYFPEHPELVT